MANTQSPKLRSACDACHEAKVRCTGGTTCVHCKNHHQTCHYSFAARIGKPKGSRNRKTLARLQEAALHAAESQSNSPTPPFCFSPSPFSVSPHSISSVPDWLNSDFQFPSTQQASYTSYACMPPQPMPSPSESIDMALRPVVMCEEPFARQQQAALSQLPETHLHSPQLSRSASIANMDFFLPAPDMSSYSQTWQSTKCNCLQWQTSNIGSLNAFNTFDESLQCITATLAACQRTVACQSCENNSSLMLVLMASLQMVFDRLDTLLSYELKAASISSPSFPPTLTSTTAIAQPKQQNIIRLLQLRHMLFKTRNTLKDIRDAIPSYQRSSSIDSACFSYVGVVPGSPSDQDCLHQVLDKLQAGIDGLLSTVSSVRT